MNFAGKMRHAQRLEPNQRPGEQIELIVGIVGIIQDRRGFGSGPPAVVAPSNRPASASAADVSLRAARRFRSCW